MKNLEALLQQLGFIESEAKVILALMELGSAKVADISKKSGVDRVNTYGILSKLMQQGLVSQNEMAGVKTYISEPPEKFWQMVKEKQDKVSKLEQEFQKSLPEFAALYNLTPHKPKVRFYEGIEGVKTVLDDILIDCQKQNIKQYSVFTSKPEVFFEELPDFQNFLDKRIKIGIKVQLITPYSIKGVTRKAKIDKQELRQRKMLPKGFGFQSLILIYGNKIAMFSTANQQIAVVLEEKNLSRTLQTFFEFMWCTLN